MCVLESVSVCVCGLEGESERETSVCVRVCVCYRERARDRVCERRRHREIGSVREGDSERARVCVIARVCELEK